MLPLSEENTSAWQMINSFRTYENQPKRHVMVKWVVYPLEFVSKGLILTLVALVFAGFSAKALASP